MRDQFALVGWSLYRLRRPPSPAICSRPRSAESRTRSRSSTSRDGLGVCVEWCPECRVQSVRSVPTCPTSDVTQRRRDIILGPTRTARMPTCLARSVRCGAPPHATPPFTYTGSLRASHVDTHSWRMVSITACRSRPAPRRRVPRRNQPSRPRLAPRPWRARPPRPMLLAKQAVEAAGLQGHLAAAQTEPPPVLLLRQPNAEVAA